MPVEEDITSLEEDIIAIESLQNGAEWNPNIQEKAAEIMAEADAKIDSLMLDKLDREQVAKMVGLLARFTRCQDINHPRRVLPSADHHCC